MHFRNRVSYTDNLYIAKLHVASEAVIVELLKYLAILF